MIYVCLHVNDDAPTVGLVLWKIRQVMEVFRREYHILVADDASSDGTSEILEPYERALPMTIRRSPYSTGYAASIDVLIREALGRTDRPRRDCVVILPSDFSVSPAVLPDLIKRVESGADVVVAETNFERAGSGMRLVRRLAPWLLKPGVQLKGFRDVTSGVCAFRLITLRSCLKESKGSLLNTEGRCANAELLARAATVARQIAVVPVEAQSPEGAHAPSEKSLSLALNLHRAGRRLNIPPPRTTVQRAS
jgi:hypothetical protein